MPDHALRPGQTAYIRLKRVLDPPLAVACALLVSPAFLLIALAVKLDSAGPLFFTQERVGIHRRHFRILKFRTMLVDAPRDTATHLLQDSERHITRVGRVLRKTSLDELPQILNIMSGTMAFVGPRPALWNQHDLITAREETGANDVMPGLTGWAQVNGRDELPISKKAQLDAEYVARVGPLIDMKCLLWTILKVARREGVAEGSPRSQ